MRIGCLVRYRNPEGIKGTSHWRIISTDNLYVAKQEQIGLCVDVGNYVNEHIIMFEDVLVRVHRSYLEAL